MDGETKPSTAVASQSLKFNANYIKSVLGLLKMVEFVCLLLAWALCSSFRNGFYGWAVYSSGAIGFFLFVTVTFWIFVILLFIANILSIMDKVNFPQKWIILSLIHGIWAVMLLIASAVATADAVKLSNVFGFCQVLSSSRYSSTTCATYDAAVAFGFLSFLIVVIDAVLHFLNHRSQAQG